MVDLQYHASATEGFCKTIRAVCSHAECQYKEQCGAHLVNIIIVYPHSINTMTKFYPSHFKNIHLFLLILIGMCFSEHGIYVKKVLASEVKNFKKYV